MLFIICIVRLNMVVCVLQNCVRTDAKSDISGLRFRSRSNSRAGSCTPAHSAIVSVARATLNEKTINQF